VKVHEGQDRRRLEFSVRIVLSREEAVPRFRVAEQETKVQWPF
jgi:hypothetical protein